MTEPARPSPMATHGVVALGDSFTQGYGIPLAGLSCQSWAAWTSWAISGCLTQHAVNGATAHQIDRDQTPLLAGLRYRLGVSMLGANDLHDDLAAFEGAAARIVAALTKASELVVLVTLPAALRNAGQPWRQTIQRIEAVNRVTQALAHQYGALFVDVRDELRGRFAMAPDHQHPTALGHLELAHVVTQALSSRGLPPLRPLPAFRDLRPLAGEAASYHVRPSALLKGVLLSVRDDPERAAVALARRITRRSPAFVGRSPVEDPARHRSKP